MRKLLLILLFAFLCAGVLDAAQAPQIYAFNAASFQPGLNTGVVSIFPGSIAPFAPATAIAGVTPLPAELLGVQVRIEGEPAPLFFVSPAQINFLVGDRFAGKSVNLAVYRSGALTHFANFAVSATWGIFTSNSRGFGLAAGLGYSPTLNQYEVTAIGNQPFPITAGTAASPNYLVLFGTGLNSRRVTAIIDGLNVPVVFAGRHPGLTGADQINIQLSPALADRGLCEVRLSAEGVPANVVTVFFK